MYATLFNRLCGWSLLALALAGFFWGHVGDYLMVPPIESYILLGIGIVAVIGARSRLRYSVPVAFVVSLILLVWVILGWVYPNLAGTTEPLDTVLRLIGGGWGIYVTVHDLLLWKQSLS